MTTPTIPFYPVTHDDGINIVAAINDITRNLETPSLIADEFSSSKVYNVGDYVVYQGNLFRFTAAHSAGEWNENHVELVTVGDELKTKVDQTYIAEHTQYYSNASLSNAIAAFHNALPRNKNITSYLTDGTLWNRINGTGGFSPYEDIFPGDLITTGGQTYTPVDIGYYIRCYGFGTLNHLVMMPVGNLSIPAGTILHGSSTALSFESGESATAFKWNLSGSTNGGYKYSRIRQIIMKAADTIVLNAFGSAHVKPIKVLYPNPASSSASGLAENWSWFENSDWSSDTRMSICDLPNETQIYGQQVWGKGSAYNNGGYEVGIDKFQFALFQNDRNYVNIGSTYWLRSVHSSTYAARVHGTGYAGYDGVSNANGVRPRFVLVG